MKLVFVTQELDPDHPALAQTVDLVGALAERCDRVSVVTRYVRCELPSNVEAHTFDAGSKLGRGLAFERAFAAASRDADATLVHMVPQFALLAAPLARMRRMPILLWYTHWHAGRVLRLATAAVDRVLSVDASSFPLATPKLRAVGHAIDVHRFAPSENGSHPGPLRLLALGRTARWKGLATLLDALEQSTGDVQLEIRGPSLTDDERAHRDELQRRIDDEKLPVELLDAVPRAAVPALLGRSDAVVSPNEPRTGATLDKGVFEAAACARPVISTNAGFAPLLGGLGLPLVAPPRDPHALAAAIDAVAEADPALRASVGDELRRRVVASHSLEHWAESVLAAISEVRSPRGEAGSLP